MSKKSITLTNKSAVWLRYQIKEINKKLEASENSGLVEQSPEDMLKEFKYRIKR